MTDIIRLRTKDTTSNIWLNYLNDLVLFVFLREKVLLCRCLTYKSKYELLYCVFTVAGWQPSESGEIRSS